jgi:phage portal protein, SPP1 gp6-like|nr:MAG TPA: PORTAL PROTEIN [Caudoviricetes sp.]DAP66183.1 MAG TPA: PORTAL PROTEIN [Caudoviricetes sp.]
MKTYQDFLEVAEKSDRERMEFVLSAINNHKDSDLYKQAVIAKEYDAHRNVTIANFQKLLYTLNGKVIPDNYSPNYKLRSNFFANFITQETQYLLGNGVTLKKEENKAKLGAGFDTRLQDAAHDALVGGVSYGFWNLDHLEVFDVTEFVPLLDEENGALRSGIRFWQVCTSKPLRATLFEPDGFTQYIRRNGEEMMILEPKRGYVAVEATSEIDGTELLAYQNYPGFPIIPMYGNRAKQSELVGQREAIDCYDLIKSGFANTVDDASVIYWTISNAGGMDEIDMARFKESMRRIGVGLVDDDGAKAEAHTLTIPVEAREALLSRISDDLYRDFQMLDVTKLQGGQKTATEITAAYQPMDNKVDQFEYCVIDFLQALFKIVGIEDEPSFTRSKVTNQLEQTQMVLLAANYLDDETILNKLPWLTQEEVAEILKRKAAEDIERSFEPPEMVNDET